MAKKKADDWKRIEKGELDALIVKHSDYYALFCIEKGRKNRYIVNTLKEVKNIKNELKLRKTEMVEA